MVRALSICLQSGNAFVLLSGCMQAREWRSACRRQRYGFVGFSPNQQSNNEDDDLYPLSEDEAEPEGSALLSHTESIDLTADNVEAKVEGEREVEPEGKRKQVE